MADITISYKGATIAEVSSSGTTTLDTAGKYCEDDISLAYTKPSGGGSYVGGTVAWNQLLDGSADANWSANNATKSFSDGVCTFTASAKDGHVQLNVARTEENHVYLAIADIKETTATNLVALNWYGGEYKYCESTTNWQNVSAMSKMAVSNNNFKMRISDRRTSGWDAIQVKNFMLFDLTAMFGSAIADYAYTLESNTAGSGIAWLKANGFFKKDYYAYQLATLKSVETFAHPFKDGNDKIIGYFPMNFDLELRGILSLDANNNLQYDGDEYDGNNTVTRKYGIVNLGTLGWQKKSGKNNLFNTTLPLSTAAYGGSSTAVCKAICSKYLADYISNTYSNEVDKTVSFTATGYCYIEDSAYSDAATFATAMSGVYLVYKLATPTTESV